MYVPDDVIPEDHRKDDAKAGIHFAVTRMVGENFAPVRHYGEIENSEELPLAAVLLAWLAVGDQETHNQYLQKETRDEHGKVKETKRFLLVDMGQMFGNFAWTAGNVETPHDCYKFPPHLTAKLTADELQPAIAELRAVKDEDIRACFQDRPEQWGIVGADADAGAKRVIAARDKIEAIIKAGNPSIFKAEK